MLHPENRFFLVRVFRVVAAIMFLMAVAILLNFAGCRVTLAQEKKAGEPQAVNLEKMETVGWVQIPNPGLASPIPEIGIMRYSTLVDGELMNIYAPLHDPSTVLSYRRDHSGRFLAVRVRASDQAIFVFVIKWIPFGKETDDFIHRVAFISSLSDLPPLPRRPFPAN